MTVSVDNLLEVRLNEEDDFLKVRETLTRIGVASRKDKTLYQSCHILHKKGKYYSFMFISSCSWLLIIIQGHSFIVRTNL